ncbi:hypothetical protein [Nostoc sphaeroides]|uniref:Uncharacterized protein n=1 Tax=Nostoc sphaeroides CCNUC1 TaxID=2653204 RepID=A0A5P8WEY3_9NOSO|nr:hypothetical protein [Nostoc sphaeroides]QFS51121.1 hypothetical protein GXM_08615 [Nostoc sphaeroides CCNUC1]
MLNSISEKHTPVAIAQKLLEKIDLKLSYVDRLGSRDNRECISLLPLKISVI